MRRAILAGLASAISYAIYVLLSGRLQKSVRPISSSLYVITFGAIALSLFHHPDYSTVRSLSQLSGNLHYWYRRDLHYLAINTGARCASKAAQQEVALLMMIEPLTAAIMGAAIFHESLSLRQFIGALAIAAALVVNTTSQKPWTRPKSPALKFQNKTTDKAFEPNHGRVFL